MGEHVAAQPSITAGGVLRPVPVVAPKITVLQGTPHASMRPLLIHTNTL